MQRQEFQPFDSHRLNLIFTGLLLVAFALYVVVQAMQGGFASVLSYAMIVGGIIWVVSGRQAWWIPIPLAASIGGLVWVGFRIYTHELAMLMAAATLIPSMAINSRVFKQNRPPLGWAIYALCGYLIIHLFTSVLLARLNYQGGAGSILRVYVGALWPVVFIIGFYHFGTTRLLRMAVILISIALGIRVAIGIYTYFFPELLYFPALSVFFVLSEHGSRELRDAPLRLIILSLGLFAATKSGFYKKLLSLSVVGSIWILLLGSARITVGMLGVIPIIWLFLQRRFFLLSVTVVSGTILLIALNANPQMLEGLPRTTQRALSILIIGEKLDIQAEARMSNDWHDYLFKLGKDRWLASPLHFLVGNRVHPFDMTYASHGSDFYHRAHIAASTTRYERSLWAVLSTTGLVGGLLYFFTYYRLLRGPARDLWENKTFEFRHVVYFVALTNVAIWVIFSPYHGSFPGNEMAWSGMACAIYEDHRRQAAAARKKELETAVEPAEPIDPGIGRKKQPAR